MPWFILYTKSRNEKKVAEILQKRGVEVFCPLVKRTRQWSDRKKIIEEPLFKSYVFVNMEERERAVVFGTPGIVNFVFWLGKPAILQDYELENIRLMLKEANHETIEILEFVPNDLVLIQSGIFMGQKANVSKANGKTLYLSFDTFQMHIKVNIEETKIAKLFPDSTI